MHEFRKRELHIARLPKERMVNIRLNMKNSYPRERIKIGECHATAYGFLRINTNSDSVLIMPYLLFAR